MNPDQARDNIGQLVIWQPNERRLPVRIIRVIDEHTYGYQGRPRVVVRLDGYMSETDTAAEQLHLPPLAGRVTEMANQQP